MFSLGWGRSDETDPKVDRVLFCISRYDNTITEEVNLQRRIRLTHLAMDNAGARDPLPEPILQDRTALRDVSASRYQTSKRDAGRLLRNNEGLLGAGATKN